MGRRKGGLPYTRRHKEHFSPCLEAIGGATWDALGQRTILINAAGETAIMEVHLPSNAMNIGRLQIHFRDNDLNVGGVYNFQLDLYKYRLDIGWTLFLSAPQQYDVVSAVDMFELDLTPWAGFFVVGDILNIQVSHAAAGLGGWATDCIVVGAVLVED